MPNWIGDLVMATPLLFSLKTSYPDAKLVAMVKSPLGDLLQHDPHIDELFSFEAASGFARRAERKQIVIRLEQGHYDLGLLLTNSFSSAWWFYQAGIPRRLGFAGDMRSWLLTDPIPLPKERKREHLTKTYGKLLVPLGIKVDHPPRLYLAPEMGNQVRRTLQELGIDLMRPIIGVNPGAAYGTAKCWPPERFRETALRLLDRTDATLLFFGDRTGAALVKEICQGLSDRVLNLAGVTSLQELMAYIKLSSVLLTNDSGPMHIASALSTKVVALFGSTDERVTGPGQGSIVIHKSVSCSPCFKRTCPIDFRCMKQITVEEVVEALLQMLDSHTLSL
jgi:heptosyltransferase-2